MTGWLPFGPGYRVYFGEDGPRIVVLLLGGDKGSHTPSQFWYLYPSQEVVNIEFELKWKQFLPKGKFQTDPVYGWKEIKDRGDIKGIRFNSGVFVFFKTYTKDTQHLQTGTVDAIFCDEELPEQHYDELIMRLSATDGYFHMVFSKVLYFLF